MMLEKNRCKAKEEFIRNSKEIMDLAVRHNRRDLETRQSKMATQ